MFILAPINTESRVRRFPAVTVSLIALNILVFLFSNPAMNRQFGFIDEKDKELQEIEYRSFSAEDPTAIIEYASEYAKDPIALRERINTREIGMPDELWKEWKKVYDKFQEALNQSIPMKYGFVPRDFDFPTLITHMFIHAGFWHLFSNLVFLWLVGLNVEDDWGRPFFLGFYLLSGIVASLLDVAITHSEGPLIGASGAISGVMGAFAVQYYKTKIHFLLLIFWVPIIFPLYAWFFLPVYFLIQLIFAVYLADYLNIAFWAHIVGISFGVAVVVLLRVSGLERKYLKPLVEDALNLMDVDFSKAVEARSAGNIEEAEKHLKEILLREPSNLDAAKELIDIYIKGDNRNEAELIAKETFRMLRMEKKEPSVILNFYEGVLEGKSLISSLSPYDFYFISQMYAKRGQQREAAKVLAIAYKENRDTNDAPYILLRLIRALALSGNQKFLKKALFELQKKFPEIKNKAIAILREVKNGQK